MLYKIELQIAGTYETVRLNRKIMDVCSKGAPAVTYEDTPKDSCGRECPNKAEVVFITESEANQFIRQVCPFLPTQYVWIRVIRFSTYALATKFGSVQKTAKSIGKTIYVNEFRIQ